MVDIIIPYRHSRWHDTELKFCLRSVEQHLSDYGEVVIIGDQPRNLTGYTHIPFTDDIRPVYKEANIYNKVMAAVSDSRVSDSFLYLNDDHFLLNDYSAATFPNYYGKWHYGRDIYAQTIANTRQLLPDARFFDVHCPMLIRKKRFIEKVAAADWTKKCGYCMKTLYAHNLKGEYYADLKIRYIEPRQKIRALLKGSWWFSIDDQARSAEMLGVLEELYPKKSKYEL